MDALLSFSASSYTVVLTTDVPPAGPEQATGAASRERPRAHNKPGTTAGTQTQHFGSNCSATSSPCPLLVVPVDDSKRIGLSEYPGLTECSLNPFDFGGKPGLPVRGSGFIFRVLRALYSLVTGTCRGTPLVSTKAR